MKNKNYIQSVCSIRKKEIIVDGKTIIHTETSNFLDFAKIAYNDIGTNYPKFFKMDNLSKLAFIGAEILLKDVVDLSNNNIALLFSNKSSSLDTDMRYQKSIAEKDNYYPSPSVFVYTLPNICLGEISIRHQLKSENSFFIFDAFNPAFMVTYADILLNTHKAEMVLCGWTEYFDDEYRAFLYLVARQGSISHDIKTLQTEYIK